MGGLLVCRYGVQGAADVVGLFCFFQDRVPSLGLSRGWVWILGFGVSASRHACVAAFFCTYGMSLSDTEYIPDVQTTVLAAFGSPAALKSSTKHF